MNANEPRHGSYRDFVPRRYQATAYSPPPMLRPGMVVITSTGTFDIQADGSHKRR